MITLLATKTFLKKSWTWLKHNWYVPAVVIYTLILWLVFRRKDAASEVLEVRSESYKAQIDAINKAHEDEIKKRNEILEKYAEIVDKIEEKYAEDQKELDNKKKKEIKEIVEKYNDDPDAMAKLIADEFGFEYVEE